MADIRINALATTAASTASDDFVAVDGSANGTRKLNAFSPTFGGNLTVSGTDIKINNSTGYLYVDSGSSLTGMVLSRTNNILELYTTNVARLTISSAGNTTLAGNLTVSGTGNNIFNSGGGNLLIGGVIDSGNGNLQLKSTSGTAAGGIGFGTDTSLYRAAAQSLNLDGASSPQFSLSVGGTQKARLESYTDDLYISTLTAGKSIILRSGNATTALTLDSSQRCIANGVFWSSSSGNTSTNGFNNATAIANNLISLYGGTGSANIQIAGRVTTFDGGSGYYGLNLQVPSAAYPDFSGTVTWQNAITADARLVKLAAPISTQGGTATTPASASSGGTAGTIQWDASYIYVCTAANTWKRVAIATW